MVKDHKIALLSIGVNIALYGLKYYFAILSGSIALKAEAFHSLSDVIASVTVFIGLAIARRKTRTFPYGLYKVENLVAVGVALAIFYAGYTIVIEAVGPSRIDLKNVEWAILGILCATVVAYVFSRYELRVGREIDSPSLIADAKHIGTDMLANVVVLIALLSTFTTINLDRYAAIPIVILIAWSGGKILIDAIRVLLDASLDYETLSFADKLITAEPQVTQIKSLTGRNSGRYKFIEVYLLLKAHDLDTASFIANRIEKTLKDRIENVDRVLIHYEPAQKDCTVYGLPLEDAIGKRVSQHFGEAPYFAIIKVHLADRKIIEHLIVSNPHTNVAQGKGIRVAKWLIKQGIDVVITQKGFEGKGPYYVFSNAAVENIQVAAETLTDVLQHIGNSKQSSP